MAKQKTVSKPDPKPEQEKVYEDTLSITEVVDDIIEALENAGTMCMIARNVLDATGQSTSRIVSASMRINEVVQMLKPYIQ